MSISNLSKNVSDSLEAKLMVIGVPKDILSNVLEITKSPAVVANAINFSQEYGLPICQSVALLTYFGIKEAKQMISTGNFAMSDLYIRAKTTKETLPAPLSLREKEEDCRFPEVDPITYFMGRKMGWDNCEHLFNGNYRNEPDEASHGGEHWASRD